MKSRLGKMTNVIHTIRGVNMPYFTISSWMGQDANGNSVLPGDRILYFPNTKAVLAGADAEEAAKEMAARQWD